MVIEIPHNPPRTFTVSNCFLASCESLHFVVCRQKSGLVRGVGQQYKCPRTPKLVVLMKKFKCLEKIESEGSIPAKYANKRSNTSFSIWVQMMMCVSPERREEKVRMVKFWRKTEKLFVRYARKWHRRWLKKRKNGDRITNFLYKEYSSVFLDHMTRNS